MFPGMNPRDVQKAMKRMGIKQEEIEANLVIIKTANGDLVIRDPHITKMNMMGQESLQITGDIEEVENDTTPEISDDDVATVMDQANCTKEEAEEALQENKGNIAEAILKLQSK
ncbi:MAG TPA: nascent polypeptide-associated complex protein [Candidatus Nanoarchaeia archaeon]|nr:nascent polypeptide-associated complex protein [Candidatus Nanoarchaeia archaeon]